MDYSIVFVFTSANLICRSLDISKCFREALGIRDNESRLYVNGFFYCYFFSFTQTPPGIICPGRKHAVRMPSLDNQMSYREEIVQPNGKKIANADVSTTRRIFMFWAQLFKASLA